MTSHRPGSCGSPGHGSGCLCSRGTFSTCRALKAGLWEDRADPIRLPRPPPRSHLPTGNNGATPPWGHFAPDFICSGHPGRRGLCGVQKGHRPASFPGTGAMSEHLEPLLSTLQTHVPSQDHQDRLLRAEPGRPAWCQLCGPQRNKIEAGLLCGTGRQVPKIKEPCCCLLFISLLDIRGHPEGVVITGS